MQFIKTVARHVIILCLPLYGLSQSTYLPQDSKHDHFLDRLEILFQTNPDLNLSISKPITRQLAVQVSELADSLNKFFPYDYFYHLSHTDQDNLQHLLMNNSKWVTGSKESFNSKKPVWNSFYKTKANFIEVHEKDFFLDVNPVIEQNQSTFFREDRIRWIFLFLFLLTAVENIAFHRMIFEGESNRNY